jgi:Ras GTPase-activating protein 3
MLNDADLIKYITSLTDNMGKKKELMKSIVSVFAERKIIEKLVNKLTEAEVRDTAETGTLFRSNSLAAICVDSYLNLAGASLLQQVMKEPIAETYKSKRSCELDPTRLTPKDSAEKNLETLIGRVQSIWSNIQISTVQVPPALRNIFSHLQDLVSHKWPSEPNVKYLAVSGFIFLRYFCAALLGPHLFGLSDGSCPVPCYRITHLHCY